MQIDFKDIRGVDFLIDSLDEEYSSYRVRLSVYWKTPVLYVFIYSKDGYLLGEDIVVAFLVNETWYIPREKVKTR